MSMEKYKELVQKMDPEQKQNELDSLFSISDHTEEVRQKVWILVSNMKNKKIF